MQWRRPRIALTLGDPAGIGPEIVCAALLALPEIAARVTVFGDAHVGERLPAHTRLEIVSTLDAADRRPGQPTRAGGAAQIQYLEAAAHAAKHGHVDALVTAPIHKGHARAAGFAFAGHTDFLAATFDAPEVAMMFVGPRLRVVLATVHVALAQVPGLLTVNHIRSAALLGTRALSAWLRVERPRVGVVGLNPHAGEGGLFGDEEQRIVAPAIDEIRDELGRTGVLATVSGPLVPDAAFRQALAGEFDLLVALYHDQGLIPVKLVDFDHTVNVTLGLPIVRTSVDHGVAYDLAGTNTASSASLQAALVLADAMATT